MSRRTACWRGMRFTNPARFDVQHLADRSPLRRPAPTGLRGCFCTMVTCRRNPVGDPAGSPGTDGSAWRRSRTCPGELRRTHCTSDTTGMGSMHDAGSRSARVHCRFYQASSSEVDLAPRRHRRTVRRRSTRDHRNGAAKGLFVLGRHNYHGVRIVRRPAASCSITNHRGAVRRSVTRAVARYQEPVSSPKIMGNLDTVATGGTRPKPTSKGMWRMLQTAAVTSFGDQAVLPCVVRAGRVPGGTVWTLAAVREKFDQRYLRPTEV